MMRTPDLVIRLAEAVAHRTDDEPTTFPEILTELWHTRRPWLIHPVVIGLALCGMLFGIGRARPPDPSYAMMTREDPRALVRQDLAFLLSQCRSRDDPDVFALVPGQACDIRRGEHWAPAVPAFVVPRVPVDDAVVFRRCRLTAPGDLSRRVVPGPCPEGWSDDGFTFYAWRIPRPGLRQVKEYHVTATPTPPGGYFYTTAGRDLPSGLSPSGRSFWVLA